MALLRHLPFAIGMLLVLVGAGNVLVGSGKVVEYEALILERTAEAPASRLIAATQLSPRQAAAVLSPLRQGGGNEQAAVGKLAFYRVVTAGGWGLIALGLGNCALAGVRHGRRLRHPQESRSY